METHAAKGFEEAGLLSGSEGRARSALARPHEDSGAWIFKRLTAALENTGAGYIRVL